jgi:hypothetical protein
MRQVIEKCHAKGMSVEGTSEPTGLSLEEVNAIFISLA